MALPTLKISAYVVGLASCSGLGVFALKTLSSSKENKKTNTPKVRDLLKEKGYSIISFEGEGWGTILSAYKNSENSGIIKFGSSINISKDDLKRECASALEDILTSSYDKAKRWCVEPKKVSDKLKELNLSPLKTEVNEGQDDSENWKKLEKEYSKQGVERIIGLEPSTATETSWHGLRDKCKILFDSQPWNNEYDYSLKLSQKWCVSQSIPSDS